MTRRCGPRWPRPWTGLGGLDVLVNNAGIGAAGGVADSTDEDWLAVLNVNADTGTARVSRAAWPYLCASGHAAVVNTSSVAATTGLPQRAVYSASKGAVSALTRAMAADGLAEGIRQNAVNPGTADTPWVARLLAAAADPAAERAALAARQPHGLWVTADEVAQVVVYLASPRAALHHRRRVRGGRRPVPPAPAAPVMTGPAPGGPDGDHPLLPQRRVRQTPAHGQPGGVRRGLGLGNLGPGRPATPRPPRRCRRRGPVHLVLLDTAPHYGLGLSEARLGAALRSRPRSGLRPVRPRSAGCWKTTRRRPGRTWRRAGSRCRTGCAAGSTIPPAGVRRSLEDSLDPARPGPGGHRLRARPRRLPGRGDLRGHPGTGPDARGGHHQRGRGGHEPVAGAAAHGPGDRSRRGHAGLPVDAAGPLRRSRCWTSARPGVCPWSPPRRSTPACWPSPGRRTDAHFNYGPAGAGAAGPGP